MHGSIVEKQQNKLSFLHTSPNLSMPNTNSVMLHSIKKIKVTHFFWLKFLYKEWFIICMFNLINKIISFLYFYNSSITTNNRPFKNQGAVVVMVI